MQHLYAPWREKYFSEKRDKCPFCKAVQSPSEDNERGVVFRGKYCFGIMNLYPYSPGEFMVIPNEHSDNIESLKRECWIEISDYVRMGVRILKQSLGAKGVNIGMNLGSPAGAGIAEHVHYHLVPRWQGDTNFITTIAQTRVAGVDFEGLYHKIKKAFVKEINNGF